MKPLPFALLKISALLLLVPLSGISQVASVSTTDVCIYGGTSAGVMAAHAAARLGKSVLLIEPGSMLGGLSSGGLGYTDIGIKSSIKGLAEDFYKKVGKHYNVKESFQFEPRVAEKLFNEYANISGITIRYHLQLAAVTKQGTKIDNIVLENPDLPGNRHIVFAGVFIDASYEGDLLAKSGVSFTYGRENKSFYNEKYNGVYLESHSIQQFPESVSPYKIPGDPASGFVWGISGSTLEPIGTGDKKIQAYNYRVCLTSDPNNQIPFFKPEGYDSKQFELLARLFKAQPDKQLVNDYLHFGTLPNKKADINNNGPFSTDMIGENYNYIEGTYTERQAIREKHKRYTQGLFYFLANDERVPESVQKTFRKWGYPKDEYAAFGNWTPQIYIREARRMVSDYVMTEANCLGETTATDSIASGSYTMDSHQVQRVVVTKNGKEVVKNEGNLQIPVKEPYPISYRAIIPKEEECTNLIVPVCLSASHTAYGSIRMEPVFMQLGQVAGVAAAMAVHTDKTVQKLDFAALQRKLITDPLSAEPLRDPSQQDDWVVRIHPNPIHSNFYLRSYGLGNTEIKIGIYDSAGNSVYESVRPVDSRDNIFNLNVDNLSRGIYYIVIQADGKKVSKKLLVE